MSYPHLRMVFVRAPIEAPLNGVEPQPGTPPVYTFQGRDKRTRVAFGTTHLQNNKSFFKIQLLTKILTLGQSPECHDTETISLKVVTLLVHSQ